LVRPLSIRTRPRSGAWSTRFATWSRSQD